MPSKTETHQLAHHEYQNKSQSKEIIIACDGVKGPANLGALFRIGDAFDVQKFLFSAPINIASPRLKKTARNTEKNIPFQIVKGLVPQMEELKIQGYHLIAVELTTQSIPLPKWNTSVDKVVLILGNEATGVSEEILRMTDSVVHIPMFGKNSSLNVATAAGIVLYEISKA